eukprot:TRINITY_DN25428_c0_g1_i1.p3 TRINITY_DN25428_c0_g1~~TRINITY_DN25428_c0_g1_i1.p3  ORF type:complete len:102 (+),score=1.31 TRINITY_DN25428_c0_g1_i1:58-363(+)
MEKGWKSCATILASSSSIEFCRAVVRNFCKNCLIVLWDVDAGRWGPGWVVGMGAGIVAAAEDVVEVDALAAEDVVEVAPEGSLGRDSASSTAECNVRMCLC